MNFNNLVFPFKRYQMQRVWRGERPQMGRMREFYQCDIDVINVDNLPISFDAEVASMMYEVLESLNIGKVQLRISNRKILTGIINYQLKITDPEEITQIFRVVDKLEKVGMDEFFRNLHNTIISLKPNCPKQKIENLVEVLGIAKALKGKSIKYQLEGIDGLIEKYKDENPDNLSIKGFMELREVLSGLSHLPEHAVVADLSIVRGLDYYTGTVYETQLLDVPEFTGSVCSGGRYDDLAGSYINKHLPGVGISLGFSRLFDVIKQKRPDLMGLDDKSPKGPAHVMMMVPENEADRPLAYDAARTLRKNGVNVEMYHAPKKFGDQLKYASKKNIPYVWVIRDGQHEVKDMNAQTQTQADPKTWTPPARKALDEVA
jgi:histidyl-tRNA synthetase